MLCLYPSYYNFPQNINNKNSSLLSLVVILSPAHLPNLLLKVGGNY